MRVIIYKINKIFPVLFVATLFTNSCEKSPTNTGPILSVTMAPNSKIADSTVVGIPTIQGNTFTFQTNGTDPDFQVGDVLVVQSDGGYIRNITGVTTSGNQIQLLTTQATLVDVFDELLLIDATVLEIDGSLSKHHPNAPVMKINYLPEGAYLEKGKIILDGIKIYSGNYEGVPFTVEFETGFIEFKPTFNRELDIGIFDGLRSFKLSALGNINFECVVKVTVNKTIDTDYSKNLADFDFGPLWIGPVPMYVNMNFEAGFDVFIDFIGEITTGFGISSMVEFGAEYKYNDWAKIWEYGSPSLKEITPEWDAKGDTEVRLYVKPKLAVTIANVAGPYMEIEPYMEFGGTVDFANKEWYWELAGGYDGRLGFEVSILDYDLVNYNKNISSDKFGIAQDSGEIESNIVSVLPGVENFEQYIPGQQLACQNPMDWTTWSENPCDATQDPIITDEISWDNNQSLLIQSGNDLVYNQKNYLTSGTYATYFYIYVPIGKQGYFNILADFNNGNICWAMSAYFNGDGTGRLEADTDVSFNYAQNTWVKVTVHTNLDADTGSFWINSDRIHQWQWTAGYNGGTVPYPQLAALDFFSIDDSYKYYIDNFRGN